RVAVSMMPRHSKPDKITLAWTPEGRFIIDSTVTKSKADEERERRIRHFQAFDADFTVREYMEASGLGDSRAQEFLVQMVEENVLKRRKDGKRWLYRVRGAVEAVDSKETGL